MNYHNDIDHDEIESPVTGGKAVLIDSLEVAHVVRLYMDKYNFDVARCFPNQEKIKKYRCEDSRYEFFYPDNVAGDSRFYDELYRNCEDDCSCYTHGKWEHTFALDLVEKNQSVLDVGAGGGAFLSLVEEKGARGTGLETNPFGLETGKKLGLKMVNELVQDHQHGRAGTYDVVTTFQVLEHVYNVKEFLTACLELLKPGGVLVVSVPNNESFIKYDKNFALNLPPHHIGYWTRDSLEALTKYFDIELTRIEYEPLQELSGWFQKVLERKYFPKNALLKKLYYKLGWHETINSIIQENSNMIHGHTILAVYKKNC